MRGAERLEQFLLGLGYISAMLGGMFYLMAGPSFALPTPWWFLWGVLLFIGGLTGSYGLLRPWRWWWWEPTGLGVLGLALLVRSLSIALFSPNAHVSVSYVATSVVLAAYALRRAEPRLEVVVVVRSALRDHENRDQD